MDTGTKQDAKFHQISFKIPNNKLKQSIMWGRTESDTTEVA